MTKKGKQIPTNQYHRVVKDVVRPADIHRVYGPGGYWDEHRPDTQLYAVERFDPADGRTLARFGGREHAAAIKLALQYDQQLAALETLIGGDPAREGRVRLYWSANCCPHCGQGTAPIGEGGAYVMAHHSHCNVAEPWAKLARRCQGAWGSSSQASVDRTIAAIWPHMEALGIDADEVVTAGCNGRLGRIQDRVAAYLRKAASAAA